MHHHHHLPKWLRSSPGWDSERGGLCSHQGGYALKLLQTRHHGSGRQLLQPQQDSWLPLLRWQGGCKEDWKQFGEGEGLPHPRPWRRQQPAPLPQLVSDHQTLIVSQLGKGNHWENNPAQKCCSAAIPFPVRQIHEHNSHWRLRRLPHNMFSGNSFSCATKYVCRIPQRITTKTTFGNRSWIAAQEIEPNQTKPFFLSVSAVLALSHATCQTDSTVICISFHHIIKWDVSWVFEFCRLHGGQFQVFTSYWCSLHQASDCCRYFPSFTGIVTIGLLSLLPTYHQLRIPLLFTVCSPSLWAAQWWSSCANYCLVDVLIL